jgi:hypothetical protein
MAGKVARVDLDNPSSVNIRLSSADRANLRVVLTHLKCRPLMPGPISISSAMRFALQELADRCRVDIQRSVNVKGF